MVSKILWAMLLGIAIVCLFIGKVEQALLYCILANQVVHTDKLSKL